MRKIGTTSTGSVIVEMSGTQFEALVQLQKDIATAPTKESAAASPAPKMNHSQRVEYVAERLKKLSPKKREGVVRSIEAMFQFTGGIEEDEIDRLLTTLGRRNFFSIAPDGKVTYRKS